jgi:plastocyanin
MVLITKKAVVIVPSPPDLMRCIMTRLIFAAVFLVLSSLTATAPLAAAEPSTTYRLTIKDHRFTPEELKVPAGQKLSLLVKNEDKTVEEFESQDLQREKIIPAGSEITIKLPALAKGTYRFFGEFHEKTAQGKIIAE